jgi:hypothetical protein
MVEAVHGSCDKGSDTGEGGCNTCRAADMREMETEIVAPSTTPTPKTVGKCLCKAGYGDKSGLAVAPSFICA